jgi:hypothetical protein
MENVMLTIKLVLFLALLLFAMGTVTAVIVAGLRQVVWNGMDEAESADEAAPESSPVASLS